MKTYKDFGDYYNPRSFFFGHCWAYYNIIDHSLKYSVLKSNPTKGVTVVYNGTCYEILNKSAVWCVRYELAKRYASYVLGVRQLVRRISITSFNESVIDRLQLLQNQFLETPYFERYYNLSVPWYDDCSDFDGSFVKLLEDIEVTPKLVLLKFSRSTIYFVG